MNRLRRIGLRILAGLFVLAGTAVILCLDLVDSRPYFRESYYARTTAQLRVRVETNQVVRGELAAGFGRARLTPSVGASQDVPAEGKFRSLALAGYGSRHGKPARGVHDDLYVKALALQVGGRLGVMVGADALIMPREVADMTMLRLREFGLSREQVYLSATHTHSSLGGWGEGIVAESFAGGYQPGARIWFSDCIVAAVREALADLKPARFGYGRFAVPQFTRNRVVGELGKVDPEFRYAVFRQDAGKVRGTGRLSAHTPRSYRAT